MFVVFISVGWGILFLLHFVVYNSISRVFSFYLPYWPILLSLLAFSYFFASFCVRMFENGVSDFIYFAASTWLGVIFISFSVILMYELVHYATGFDSPHVLGGLLVCVMVLSIYALYFGRELTVREYTVPIVGLENTVHIVHLSDIHVGTVHQEKFLTRIVETTNALSPDIILMTGDLFDGSAKIDETVLEPLKALKAPTYFSNGNHEQYEGLERVRATLQRTHLTQLENRAVENVGLQIIGVNDRQSLSRDRSLESILKDLPNIEGLPRILMYHSPSDWDIAQKYSVDLMLSGHTHNGQIFPFTLIVRIAFRYLHGLYEENGKFLHVSPGTGTWGPPMRLGSRNQITLLTLVPKNTP